MIIYADLVFLMDFFGDFLCLWLVSEIEGKIPLWRRILSSVFGGIYGILCTIESLWVLSSPIGKIICAGLLVVICSVPTDFKTILRRTALFFLSSMLLSGGAELLQSFGMLKTVPVLFGVACIVVSALSVIRSKIYAKFIPCEICFLGKKERILGFYDSGNRIYSQDNERLVVVGDRRILKRLLPQGANINNLDEWIDKDRIREISFSGVSGGVMRAIVLDYIKVGERRYDGVVLAVSENELEDKLILHSIMA